MKWLLRTSAVRVADEQGDRLYSSLEDVPVELRDKIVDSIEGSDSQTILIANQNAYDEIAEGGEELPDELRRLKPALLRHRDERAPVRRGDGGWKRLLIGGVIVILALWVSWLWALRSGT